MQSARRLSSTDMLAIGVNAIVGSGVFALPDDLARHMGPYSPLAFVLCALLLVPIASCFAELASHYDQSGGPYVYARDAFGERWGFFLGWLCWINAFISFAANAGLLAALLGYTGWTSTALMGSVIVFLAALNHIGVRPGSWTVRVLVIGKLAAIACFIVVAARALISTPALHTAPSPTSLTLRSVGSAVYLSLFPFQGFEVVPVPAGEVQNPQRAIPRATLGALGLATIIYIVVQALLVLTYPNLSATSNSPLADAARYLHPHLGRIVAVGSIVSLAGFTAGSALGSPRYAQAMSLRQQLPAPLSKLHARFSTPYVAIWVTSGVAFLLAALFPYRSLVGFSNLAVVLQYGATCAAVPILRRLHGKPATRPWATVAPYAGLLATILFVGGTDGAEWYFLLLALALGLLLYRFRAWGFPTQTDPRARS